MSKTAHNRSLAANPKDEFPILALSREDLNALGYDAINVDDTKMRRLAKEVAKDSRKQMFSNALDSAAERLKLPKSQKRQTDELLSSLLGKAHEEELVRRNAEVWNLGWYSSDTRLESKTNKGILISVIDRKSKKVAHRWATR